MSAEAAAFPRSGHGSRFPGRKPDSRRMVKVLLWLCPEIDLPNREQKTTAQEEIFMWSSKTVQ